MSIQAMSNVIGSHGHGYQDGSSATGAVFLVELMIADSVNDQNGNVFWMSNENLAKKCRLARETVNRTVRELEAGGVLRRVGHHDSGAVRWQWIGHPEGVTTDHTNPREPKMNPNPQMPISQPTQPRSPRSNERR